MFTALQTPAWLALPLGLLLVLLGVGGLFMCFRRKHNKDAGNQSGQGITSKLTVPLSYYIILFV